MKQSIFTVFLILIAAIFGCQKKKSIKVSFSQWNDSTAYFLKEQAVKSNDSILFMNRLENFEDEGGFYPFRRLFVDVLDSFVNEHDVNDLTVIEYTKRSEQTRIESAVVFNGDIYKYIYDNNEWHFWTKQKCSPTFNKENIVTIDNGTNNGDVIITQFNMKDNRIQSTYFLPFTLKMDWY
ncbi:MAG TPA: hypothetical protein VL098_08355 [Flavipsychrobacter sp.]|nr:hypothetical protein [Flavipsychrobacter sp.]